MKQTSLINKPKRTFGERDYPNTKEKENKGIF